MEPLGKCDFAEVDRIPMENEAAKTQERFNDRTFKLDLWRNKRQIFKQVAFLRATTGTCDFYAQTSRIFRNEADAK